MDRRPDHDHRQGLLHALAGFALLSVGDAVVKSMAGQWAPTAIAALRYAIGAAGLSAILLAGEGTAGFRVVRPGIQLIRGAAVATATVAFFGSLFVMPLAEATTIVFVSPMITGLLAPIFLKERAGAATWIASAIAFAGVTLVLRPNLAALGPAALLPLLAACAMSALFMANRAIAGSASALAMQASLALIAAPILTAVAALGHFSGVAALHVGTPRGGDRQVRLRGRQREHGALAHLSGHGAGRGGECGTDDLCPAAGGRCARLAVVRLAARWTGIGGRRDRYRGGTVPLAIEPHAFRGTLTRRLQ